jgi:tetratricopeptide (TPR) repeat protein
VLVAGALELSLRFFGYGYSTDFFKPMRIGQKDFLVENDKFSLRFFPPELARLPPPLRMNARKEEGVYRIFILGESAAMGDPEAAFGAGRYLGVLLRERFPAMKFEVVNVAMTAINSHAILSIARSCARRKADLWIVYMGNNEMVGAFGAATILGPKAPPLTLARLHLATQKTRLGQLLLALSRRLSGKSSLPPSWGGMQMFAANRVGPEAPAREAVYRNFQRNLEDIIRVGLDSGVRVILSTMAVNLKDCPPFASVSNSNLPPSERIQLDQRLSEAGARVAKADFAEAAQRYQDAADLDPKSAELQFHWADCLLRLTNAAAARIHLGLACDYDALPFRADSWINTLLTATAKRFEGQGVVFCDAAGALATNSPVGIAGQESFYEHVHFNFDGNYRLARLWAEEVKSLLPADVVQRGASAWASQETCERWLGLTDWNRINVLSEVRRRYQQPPLSEQANNNERLEALAAWEKEVRGRMTTNAALKARQVYQEAIERAPEDYCLHENFADFLLATGDRENAANEWQRVRELIPQDHVAFYALGRIAVARGDWTQAKALFLEALARRPNFMEAWLELGKTQAGNGEFEEALADYARAQQFQPHDSRPWFYSGLALSKLKRRAESIERYRRAVQLNPDAWEAHFELGGQLGLEGKIPEAKRELEEAIRLKPDYAMAHVNLGVALLQEGQAADAQKQFEEALRLEPTNQVARAGLRQAESRNR